MKEMNNNESGVRSFSDITDQVARATGRSNTENKSLEKDIPWEDKFRNILRSNGEKDGIETTFNQNGDILDCTYGNGSAKLMRFVDNFDVAHQGAGDFHYNISKEDYRKKWLRKGLKESPRIELHVIDKKGREEMIFIGKLE